VPKTTPDGQYGNYADAVKGSPLKVTAPIRPGAAEIRYMSGQGAKVLGRRPIAIVAAKIAMKAPGESAAGGVVSIEWTGPNNAGDYFTIVSKASKDGTVFKMTNTARGSPLKVDAPKERGACEIRYMSGQGNLVLARADIELR
jgi:Ca-activated chloride channel family protein